MTATPTQERLALLSVSNTEHIEDVARTIHNAGYALIATSGTAKRLTDAGLPVKEISVYTQAPELFGGRVKTLHPKIHGGILMRRGNKHDVEDAKKHGILPIDIVVANLYPFKETVASGASRADCIEHIDIGGVTLIRSAAKNHAHVAVVTDPAQYPDVIASLTKRGEVSASLRAALATAAFAHTAEYDTAIAHYFDPTRNTLLTHMPSRTLRYGENPHQDATLYGNLESVFTQKGGKELSYNNMLDASSALGLIREFKNELPTVAILKHTNPCGVGQAKTLVSAWKYAYATDTSAPFGGVVATNVPVDLRTAQELSKLFLEIVLAPAYEQDALALLQKKQKLRILTYKKGASKHNWQLRSIGDGLILGQTEDRTTLDMKKLKVATNRKPSAREMNNLLFAWKVAKHIKSNAVIFAKNMRTLGIGAGQMSRVDSTKIAVRKAGEAELSLKGSALASDAFFPFPDAAEAAAEAGASSIIQPGGSVKDAEVIASANKHKVAMVFTGIRHFRH